MSKTIKSKPREEEYDREDCCGKALKINDKKRKIKYLKEQKK